MAHPVPVAQFDIVFDVQEQQLQPASTLPHMGIPRSVLPTPPLSLAQVPYPPFYRSLLAWVSLFELDMFGFMPIGCAVHISFYEILVTRTAIPLVVIGALALAGWWRKSRAKARREAATGDGEESKWALKGAGVSNNLFSWCNHRM